MGLDVGNFYLETPMERYEYMKMPLALFPAHTIEQYKLHDRAKHGFVYLEIRRDIYGLLQARSLANKYLQNILRQQDTTIAHTHRVYGDTSQDRYIFHWLSTILVSSM